MATKFYLPRSLGKRRAWYFNFKGKFAASALLFGFKQADIISNNKDCDWLMWGIDVVYKAKNHYLELTSLRKRIISGKQNKTIVKHDYSDITPPNSTIKEGAEDRLRERVQIIKNSPNYKTSVGEDMLIIGAEIHSNENETKGKITSITVLNDVVYIKFLKMKFDGIILYCKRGKGDYEKIGSFGFSPAEDTRINLTESPEERTYKIIYMKHDKTFGHFSEQWAVTTNIH